MKKILLAAMIAAVPAAMQAQTAMDAYSLSQGDLRGTARFMSMAGAFTALGGDISTLNQNPGGIGIYRSSDIAATLDINMQSAKAGIGSGAETWNKTRVQCNNFGYVGAVNLGSGSVMPYFNWGFSYSRVASFDRRYRGSLGNIGTSLTNYVADYTTADGFGNNDLTAFAPGYNPYLDSGAPWMSILMYNTYGINPTANGSTHYNGLWDYNSSAGTADFSIEEKGHVDEYSINFGGNIENIVYWGIGIGIDDIDFKQNAYYGESISNAVVPAANADGLAQGTADYQLANWKHVYGTGVNFKIGVIVKPINEFRIGLAFHTPTYYNLSYEGVARADYLYTSPSYPEGKTISSAGVDDYTNYTDYGYLDTFDWKLRSPWRMTLGVAGVIGGRGIISADYEYRAYQSMTVKDGDGYSHADVNHDIKTHYQAVNILRLGAEYRLSSSWSVRAGYSFESSPVTTSTLDGNDAVYTSGPDDTETQPSFDLSRSTQYITCGLGWHYKNFYADAAYVHRYNRSKYQPFSNYVANVPEADGSLSFVTAPSSTVTRNDNSIVLTLGFRF